MGSDADIVIWDPDCSKVISAKTHISLNDFNIFEGVEVRGYPAVVISRGKVVVDEKGVQVEKGWGRFISTPRNSTYVYGRVKARDQVKLSCGFLNLF